MKERLRVEVPGFSAEYNIEWFEDTDFLKIENIKQVYGILFNKEGEMLVINTVGNWQLPGGKPECNESWEETAIRESMEEADVEIENIIPLGFQRVSEIKRDEELPFFHQIRFVANIKKLNESSIDPATGKVPERRFIKPEEFLKYCPWGKISQYIINLAEEKRVKPAPVKH
ncbi:NUDIX hydrolase [archaeon]|jgi:ADP-ribose pyrophosphatase YjhB (NUDIX family)|nr:NUDIX hydrolase [archaeon]MBT6955842.1 NUDIX hydrolase [archaeon]MBT7128282.1 NUDIX hydrolase [archaeon]